MTINLMGDRDIEWGWVFARLPDARDAAAGGGRPRALDFGCGKSFCGLVAALRGYDVTCLDLDPPPRFHGHPHLHLLKGDLLTLQWPAASVDLVINCSTVEHVGLAGRYGVDRDDTDGDLRAMSTLHTLMRPGAAMLLTLPVGRDAVFPPMCRVYGEVRLPRLLDGFTLVEEAFWVKDAENRYVPGPRAAALAFEASAGDSDPMENRYALGCFVLRR